MADSPTISIAKLDDKELMQSITNLVANVKRATHTMTADFDKAVDSMNSKLKELGSINKGSGNAGIDQRTSSLKKEEEQTKANTQAVREYNRAKKESLTLDQQTQAKSTALGGKKSIDYMEFKSNVDDSLTYLINVNKDVDAQMEAILRKERELLEAKQKEAQVTEQIVQTQRNLGPYSPQNTDDQAKRLAQSRELVASYNQEAQAITTKNAAIMQTLHIGKEEIKNYDIRSASAKQLNAMLKQQRDAYANLTTSQRFQKGGVELAESIQKTERALQKLQATASRPVNLKAALGLSERTLDDLAYKMRQLNSYKMGLNFKTQAEEMKQVDIAIARLKRDYDDLMSKNQQLFASNTALGRSWNYMKNRLAFYFSVGASTAFVKNLIEVRSQYEMNERALGILIDSAERGTRIFNELSQMALVSPYTLIELSTAAKQLTAYDIAAKDVVETTRRLADMAAAVGIPIERLTYALGQIKAYGYLNARDARMFSNAGIPLVKQLSQYYTELEGKMVSTADVYDRIKKKTIDMSDVMQVINKMTDDGGKFFDFQAKMAGTLKVQLANLTLAWNNMLNDIGASQQGTLTTGIKLLKEFFLQWKNISNMVGNLAYGFGLVKAAQLLYYGVVMGTNKAIALEVVLGDKLSRKLRSLTASTNAAKAASTTMWVAIATAAAAAVIEIIHGNEAMREFNETLRENAKNTYNDLSNFSEQYKKLRESLYKKEVIKHDNGKAGYRIVPNDINNDEANKAWSAMREQIELSSHASDEYIGKLLSIENVSERLRQGFKIIDDIQSVSAAIKELGNDAIKLEREWSAWWNLGLLPDGTIGNLKNAYTWLSKIEEKYGSIQNARKVASADKTDEGLPNIFKKEAESYIESYEEELAQFREDIKTTKQSVIDFINLKGWSGETNKINEAFKTFTDNLVLKNQLNPQQAYALQLEMEEARSKAAKDALLKRINDEKASLRVTHDSSVREALAKDIEEYNNWNNFNGRKKVEWERFTKWLKEQHISETTAMFRNMDAEDIKSLNFQEGKHAEWVTRMVTQYAKEHKMSYDEAFSYLRSWVSSANQWSIYIPLIISTEDKKSVYEQLGEYDKAIDEASAKIDRLKTRIKELNAKKKKSKEETQELADAEKELAQAEKDKAEAEAKGGHGKKTEKKNAREQAKAEKEVSEALKQQLSIIKDIQSSYEKLRKAGVNNTDAIKMSTQGYEATLKRVNSILSKYGVNKFNAKTFAGKNVRELLDSLEKQRTALISNRKVKTSALEALDIEIKKLRIDAKTYDLEKVTKSLNNELGKLKDEYELAVEFDANPEMGNIFADLIGIDKDSLGKLPKDFNSLLKKMQERIDETISTDKYFDLKKNLNKSAFEGWLAGANIDNDSEQAKALKSYVDYANKVRQDETKKQVEEWNKLLEKYAEYEYKRKQIFDEYNREMDVARKKGAGSDITDAITNRYKQNLADLDFNEFMKSPEWVVATGDLANMSKRALDTLISRIEEYRRSAKNLSPKQIKQINQTLKSLYAEQRKNNPFKAISNMLDEARSRMANFDEDIEKTQKKIDKLKAQKRQNILESVVDEETNTALNKAIKKLGQLKKAKEEAGRSDASSWVGAINEFAGGVQSAVGLVNDLAKAIAGVDKTIVDDVFSIIGTAGSGAATGAVIGGGYGAAIGAAMGLATGLINVIRGLSGDDINDEIKESERQVKRLENAYKDLEDAINHAYGTAAIAAKRTAIFNKELQLAELKRQLALEQSRSSKDRDRDRIIELEGQIKDLELEIKNTAEDIVNDLLGISSVGDAMETMMDSFINALRNGEDAMSAFDESVNNMIANMIKKLYVTKILEPWFGSIWSSIEKKVNDRTKGFYEDLARYYSIDYWESVAADGAYSQVKAWDGNGESMKEHFRGIWGDIVDQMDWGGTYQDFAKSLVSAYKSGGLTVDDIREFAELVKADSPIIQEGLKEVNAILEELGLINSNKTLSALQQGISGITEDTAGALESYMNGISQQVYLHSELLTQIRDIISGMSLDEQLGVQAQILLQLQDSYQIQKSIHLILEGVVNPSGQAFRVELTN